jgi:hypothetical protein
VTAPGRDETPEQEADRHWSDLLQELRVTETGAQVLFSLLLTIPFTARFGEVTPFQRRVYFAALLLSAAANLVLIAPVAYHRVLFRRGQKARVVAHSSRLAVAGLALLALSVSAVLLLVCDVLFSTAAAVALGVGCGVVTLALWFAPPLRRLRRA